MIVELLAYCILAVAVYGGITEHRRRKRLTPEERAQEDEEVRQALREW